MPNNPTFWSKSDHTHTIQTSDYIHATPASIKDIEVLDPAKGLILHSSNGKHWRLTVNNSGSLVITEVV